MLFSNGSLGAWRFCTVVLVCLAAGCTSWKNESPVATTVVKSDPWLRPAQVPHPADNIPTPARVALGRTLFFDPRLSGSNAISCATCHNPAMGWSDGHKAALGFNSKQLKRATPTILNTAYQPQQMWDGRKTTLEDQATGPIGSKDEMNLSLEDLEARLRAIPGYAPLFEQAYPGEGISAATVSKAIASYERTIVSTTSDFDRWRQGNTSAMNATAKRGFDLFQNKARCALCHQGFNFTDNGFHNIGLTGGDDPDDMGRFAHRKVKVLKGAFKTPTLRDVALTAPYMHNGIYQTLEEVVEHYDRGGDDKQNLDPNIQPLGLTKAEKDDLVAFMRSLTGTPMVVQVPMLPPG